MVILLGLLTVVVVLLALPLEFEFDARWPVTERNRVRLRWAFGLVRTELSSGVPKPRTEGARSERTADTGGRAITRGASVSIVQALKVAEFRQRLWRFARDIWRSLHKEGLRIHCRLGLQTPADTGMLWGVIGPIGGVLQAVPDCAIVLQPDFDRETLEISGHGAIRVYPVQVLTAVIALLMSPGLWRGISAMRVKR